MFALSLSLFQSSSRFTFIFFIESPRPQINTYASLRMVAIDSGLVFGEDMSILNILASAFSVGLVASISILNFI